MISRRLVVVLLAVGGLLHGVHAAAAAGDCEGLARLALAGVTVTTAESVPAGPFSPPEGSPIPGLPAFCRVAGVSRPSPDSDIRFEVWLPAAGWSGRYQGVGNGGFAGEISYAAMAGAVKNGDATSSTDTGHRSPNPTAAGWAFGHPEKIVDFGYRAVHETAVAAKALIAAFYGRAPRRSYFASCSNGGRQALMEAQRFPGDYDGIIAGAPANDWTHLLANAAWDVNALLAETDSYIPPEKLPAIQAAALAACDALDGVKDGMIENPSRCHAKPSALLCRESESASCLTQAQATALDKLYAGSRTSAGKPFFPGYSPGGEAEPGGWQPWITGAGPAKSLMYAFATQFFGNMVFDDPAWDFHRFELDRDAKIADEKLARVLNATNPDLHGFQARGGKLLLYHGWSDAAIPAASTVAYYNSVASKMGPVTDGFVRLFMVPGMQHCGGGSGATLFGQSGPRDADAERDIRVALERWVEHGVPPSRIIAVKRQDNADPGSTVLLSRPLCPFPQVATYKGSGSTSEAASFACTVPRGGGR